MTLSEALQTIIAALDEAGLAYMLTGSFAGAYYGVPRSTQDIDIVIEGAAPQLRKFVEGLPASRYYSDLEAAINAQRRESMFNIIDVTSGWKIDMIIRKSRDFSREEFARRRPASLQGVQLFVASAEDLIVAKLEWAKIGHSQRQIEDAGVILRVQSTLLDRSYLEKWASVLGLEREWEAVRRMAES